MSTHVPDEGSRAARIVLVGEAPGRWEMVYGRPFVGPSWTDKLLPWLREAGITRSMLFITNVLDYQPQPHIDRVPAGELHEAMARLHERLALLEDPWLIVPTGNYALYALCGKGRVSFHERDGRWLRPGITEWRGSILSYEDKRGRSIKVIPTLHPKETFKVPAYEKACRADWARIASDATFRELRLPERTHLIAPSASEVREYIDWTRAQSNVVLSLDVETPKRVEYETRQRESTAANGKCCGCGHTKRWHGGAAGPAMTAQHCLGLRGKGGCSCAGFAPTLSKPRRVKVEEEPYLGCIGYSWDPKLSLTVPLTLAYWQDPAVLADIKQRLATLHADEAIDKVRQNGSFDDYWCATEGMPVAGTLWDLMEMHRVRCPADPQHDLAYQASLYTRQPYWKDEAKDPDSIAKYAHNNEALWTYNGIDNCVQRELFDCHSAALQAQGRWDYYREIIQPMAPALLELSLHGVRADEPARAREYERVVAEAASLADEIAEAAGSRLVAKTAVSTKKMRAFLYEELRLPVQYTKNAKKQKTVSTDVVAIKRLMERFPQMPRLHAVGTLVLRHRRLNTIKGFVNAAHVDPDGRIRAQFKQDTLLGRLSSQANPRGGGRNLQNIDRKLRHLFLPDVVP